jgi:ATP-binding cassette, subfamily C (CFTR/MRP), member 4
MTSDTAVPGAGVNPFDSSSLMSQLFFNWAGTLLKTGSGKTITNEDIPAAAQSDKASLLVAKLMTAIKAYKGYKRPLLRAMIAVFAKDYAWIGLLVMVQIPVRIFQANLLGYLSNIFFDIDNSDVALYNNGYAIAALLVSCSFFTIMLNHQYGFRGGRFGTQARVALLGVIYNKAVRLHLRSLSKASTGSIVSLASQDVEILQLCGMFVHYTYLGVIEAAAVLYFGMELVGLPFLAGFVAIILLVPLQYLFSRMMGRNRKQTAAYTDERMKIVNQALVGVRVMKMNGWEWAFNELIQQVRKQELGSLMQTNYLKAVNEAIFFSAPTVISCIVWVTFVRSGGTLTPRKMFTVMAYLNFVQLTLTKFFGMSVQFTTEAWVSVERIDALLRLDDVDGSPSGNSRSGGGENQALLSPAAAVAKGGSGGEVSLKEVELTAVAPPVDAAAPDCVVCCRKMCASWTDVDPESTEATHTLTNVDYQIRANELIVVVGTVGSSKSSMLMALLGELTPFAGSVRLAEGVTSSYCAQEPWIMSSTIRSNILFGRDMDQKWYDEVVRACALLSDFAMLAEGDATVIGDRGVNLSGGQRARVGLARAVYGKASLNLLDDPLSAVDPNISAQLFNNVICGTLTQSTRVLVTHQTQYLSSPAVSRVMILDRGKIVAFDSCAALKSSGELAQWVDVLDKEEQRRRASSAMSIDSDGGSIASSGGPSRQQSGSAVSRHNSTNVPAISHVPSVDESDVQDSSLPVPLQTENGVEAKTPPPAGITVVEEIGFGDIGWRSISAYAGYVGTAIVWIPLVLLLILGQAAAVFVMIYLARWSKMDREDQLRESTLNVYYILVVVAVSLALFKSCVWYKVCAVVVSVRH